MKTPGPDHPITLTPAPTRWRARFAGHVIADTTDALILQEASYPAVVYFPRADVAMDYMSRTDRSTHCPYKGDAAYYTVLMDGQFADNAVWTYEDPFPAMTGIAGRLAFYPDKVEVYEVADAVTGEAADAPAASVDEVVQHTDSGSGASQQAPWAPTVDDGGVR
ncbi:DUF427 domain-containing protein [Phenylobacterium sp.]|uniref:DUF427 domain-containing protein n=1 Tax=Phenylobacterium sp. TaxID=1871053 RepID=UPI0035694194